MNRKRPPIPVIVILVLALLVALAATVEHGLSRDKLLGLLWPEAESERVQVGP